MLFPNLLFSFSKIALRTLHIGRFINLILLNCCIGVYNLFNHFLINGWALPNLPLLLEQQWI